MPRVSVIIPVFNRADLISEAIDSVLAQTYRDFEIIIVDDGSTDNTLRVLSDYKAHNNVRVISQRNQGQAIARNTGIQASKGVLIAFLDSDDLWLPEKLQRQVSLFDSIPNLAWCYSDAMCFSGKKNEDLYPFSRCNKPYEGQIAPHLLLRCFIPTLTVVIQRWVFEEVGFFHKLAAAGEDWDLWLRIAAKYPVRRVSEVLARYRVHEGNISGSQSITLKHKCYVEVIERAVAFAPEIYEPLRQKALAVRTLEAGRQFLIQGLMPEARRMFIEAIHYNSHTPVPYLCWLLTLIGSKAVESLVKIRRMIRKRTRVYASYYVPNSGK